MKKTLLSLFLALAVVLPCLAWGPTGHRVTGWIANKYLSKKARNAINKILDGQSLAMAGTWMDDVRSDSTFDYMTAWHWVTIPRGVPYGQSPKNPDGDIIESIERIVAGLRSGHLHPAVEAEHLKVLIHLVGDIHQPLHVGSRDDRGGNNFRVYWFGKASNLHRVWDSDIIDNSRLSFTELAGSLEVPARKTVAAWQRSPVMEWALESQSFEEQVYDTGDGRLGYRYAYVNFPVIRLRLLQAGVRLAGILNELYG